MKKHLVSFIRGDFGAIAVLTVAVTVTLGAILFCLDIPSSQSHSGNCSQWSITSGSVERRIYAFDK